MGKQNQVDKLALCLIGLVISAFVLCGPQAARAQESAGETPSAGEETARESAAEDAKDSETADAPSVQAEADEGQAPEEESGEAEAADSAATSAPEDGEATGQTADAQTTPAPNEAASTNGDSGAKGNDATTVDAPDAAGAAMTAQELPAERAPDSDPAAPASATPTAADDLPANSPAGPTQVRARDPVTGTKDPFEYEPVPLGEEDAEDGGEEEFSARDPLEGMNRAFFKFNDFLDKLLLKPVAHVYRFVLPSYVQDRIRNVVNNADTPVILANDILQWKWDRAWNTTSRFFINTTLGVGGIWDVAASFGIDRHTEDFGQTLCVWGVGEWLYLYLPFVGPTNPRDITGKVVDRFFDPLSYYADVVQQVNLSDGIDIKFNVDRAGMAQLALTAADLIDMRARNIDTINEIERTSIDFYTAVRSLYRQSRDSACKDGQVDFEDLPDLSDEFE